MSDFELLKSLQTELTNTLENRHNSKLINKMNSKTRIRRLRILINEVMLRIERGCISYYHHEKESWE